MPVIRHVSPRNGDVVLLVGTMKGAFLLRSDAGRRDWDVGGPYFAGSAVYALACDRRAGRHRIWAGPHSMHWGGMLRCTDDFGKTWTNPEAANVKFPEGAGAALQQIWQIVPPRERARHALLRRRAGGVVRLARCRRHVVAGRGAVEPSAAPALAAGRRRAVPAHHPARSRAARSHPRRRVERGHVCDRDGGTWRPSNKGVRADFLPEKYPEFGQCVHKVVQAARQPDRMYLQNHWGLYRSNDRGDTWTDIANEVPSDFGFGMAIHPENPDCAWIVPLESDQFRCTPEGKLRVYRTRDAGAHWDAMSSGLPQEGAYETVLRDALAVDSLAVPGVYFGTRSGKLFGSPDEGETWTAIADGLPPVIAVKAAVL
jgi:hypothetical protein